MILRSQKQKEIDSLEECMTQEIKVEKEFPLEEEEALHFYGAYEISKTEKTDLLREYMTQEIKYEQELQIEEEETLHFYNACEVPKVEKTDSLEECMTQEINEKEFQLEKEKTSHFYNTCKTFAIHVKARKILLLEEDKDEEEEDEDEEYFPEENCPSIELISSDYKRLAVKYWKSAKKRPRSLESVRRRFRKVTSVRQLRRWEKQINKGGSRLEKLKRISVYTLNHFKEAREKGIIVRNIDIARWASQAQEEENVPGFKVSKSWVRRFKSAHPEITRISKEQPTNIPDNITSKIGT